MSKLAILGGDPVRRRPFPAWPQFRESDIARLVRTVESRRWGGFPYPTKMAGAFCEAFAAEQGARYALPVANGTIAITAALMAAGIAPGDEVIVPAYTWDGTATAAMAMGAVPVFVDVDPDTYCIDVEAVRRAITPKTRAVIPVHLAMRFADMDALGELANAHGLVVIEDCAHAHGGAYRGRGAGAMGDIGCFSLQESKLMTAGEGGLLTTNELKHYEALQTVINCGRASLTDQYGQRLLGLNFRMTDLQIALLVGQLEMLPELREKRAARAAMLTGELAGVDCLRALPEQAGITKPTYYTYVLQYRPPAGKAAPHRDLFAAAVEAEGVPCDGRFYEAVYRSDLFCAPEGTWRRMACPVAERAAYEESLWFFQFCLIGDEEDARDVARAIQKVAGGLDELARQDEGLAGAKAMGRAQRARWERGKNY